MNHGKPFSLSLPSGPHRGRIAGALAPYHLGPRCLLPVSSNQPAASLAKPQAQPMDPREEVARKDRDRTIFLNNIRELASMIASVWSAPPINEQWLRMIKEAACFDEMAVILSSYVMHRALIERSRCLASRN